jgi:hypothetical protein
MGSTDTTDIPFVANYYPEGLVGFVYEADIFCVTCAMERFGQDLTMRVAGGHQQSYPYETKEPNPPLDNEGNPVSAVTGSMEFQCSLFCGDCRKELSEQVTILHEIVTDKRKCRYCGRTRKEMGPNVYVRESNQ